MLPLLYFIVVVDCLGVKIFHQVAHSVILLSGSTLSKTMTVENKSIIFICIIFLFIIYKDPCAGHTGWEKDKNTLTGKKLAVHTAIPYGVSLFCADEGQPAQSDNH